MRVDTLVSLLSCFFLNHGPARDVMEQVQNRDNGCYRTRGDRQTTGRGVQRSFIEAYKAWEAAEDGTDQQGYRAHLQTVRCSSAVAQRAGSTCWGNPVSTLVY